MAADGHETDPYRINRREALKRTAIATGIAWSAPILTSIRTPAFAQYGAPCEEGCTYVAHFDLPSVACSPCQDVCRGDCAQYQNPCTGPACARITSVTCLVDDPTPGANFLRVCTDCEQLTGDLVACISVPEDCTCVGGTVDPSDPSCARYDLIFTDACERAQVNVSFSCSAC